MKSNINDQFSIPLFKFLNKNKKRINRNLEFDIYLNLKRNMENTQDYLNVFTIRNMINLQLRKEMDFQCFLHDKE